MTRAIVALFAALAVTGSLEITFADAQPAVAPEEVEVRLGALAAGSSAGLNASDATASVAGVLLAGTTNVLYLNNTNASGAWFVKLETVGTTGAGNIASLTVGVDNGTASVAQVTGALGSITQSAGASWVRLEPGSANQIYVTQAVSLLGPDVILPLQVHVADTTAGDAYVTTDATVTIT